MIRFLLRHLMHVISLVALTGGVSLAQPGQLPPRFGQPAPHTPAADKDDIEVLARGPIHEAYAATAEMPTGGPVVDKRPPDPVEELPPDQKPDGDNVQWVPGYWQYDEERKDFIWISGFWRDAPPGRVWVPGGWQEVRNGFQWVSGFWNVPAPAAQPGVVPQAQLEYLPPPPATLETGPTLVSPGDDHFYTPGCWVYRVNRYVWRPGFWVTHRPNWVWVPDQYRWTPCGFVFVPGYWDVPLERRGVLFAPVFFRPAVVLRPRFVYTPVYAVPAPCLHTSLFVRTGYSGYFFGDYFEPRYVTAGFSSWAVGVRGSNFAVGVSGGRGFAYDPLWSYYSVAYRREPAWQRNIASVYAGRFNGTVARPPRTLVQQTTVINNITNNNTTVVNNSITNNNRTVNNPPPATAAQVTMLAPLADLKKASPTVALKPVAVEDRTKEQQAAKELRQVAAERRRAEAQLVARGQVPTKADDKPQQVKVELSKTAVARSRMPAKADNAPPPAPTPAMRRPDAPTVPPTGVKPGAKPTVPTVPPMNDSTKGPPAKVDGPVKPNDPLKTGPGTPVPPIGPKPTDPKPPVNPPKNDPPKGPPATPPKVDPPKPGNPPKGPPVSPPKTDPPKVNPPKGPTIPPVGPKPGDPPKPKDPPKTDLPKGPTIPPVMPPVGPKPKDPPKGPPQKADPPKSGPGNPMPPVVPPKAPPPRVNPPKPQPPAAPPPQVDPPKSPVSNPPPKSPAAPPPKVDPPKSNPPKGPGAPSRPTRGDDKKDDKRK